MHCVGISETILELQFSLIGNSFIKKFVVHILLQAVMLEILSREIIDKIQIRIILFTNEQKINVLTKELAKTKS